MNDYCACGQVAEMRCGCGTFLCRLHQQWTDVGDLNFRIQRNPDHQLVTMLRAMHEAWQMARAWSCADCVYQDTWTVAQMWAKAFRDHDVVREEVMAATIIGLGQWNRGSRYNPRSLGQLTLDAAGYSPPWSHPEPDITAAEILVAYCQVPEYEWLVDGQAMLYKRMKYRTVPGAPVWWTVYSFEAGERLWDHVPLFVTKEGVILSAAGTVLRDGALHLGTTDASELRQRLSSPHPLGRPAYESLDTEISRAQSMIGLSELEIRFN
jgi:hypothetical protein